MVLTMEMGEDWDLRPTIPFYFAREKRYSSHKQSAEFVAIKRPLKKSNQSLSLEGIFGGGEGARRGGPPARVRLSSPGRRRARREGASSAGKNNCFVPSFVRSRYVVTI